jgi:hypothetical protein
MLFFLLGFPVVARAGGGWIIFVEEAFSGRVIDAETKEPIEGAVVNAIYYKRCFNLFHADSYVIRVREILTGADGTIRIPSYWTLVSPNCWYGFSNLIVFKPGFGDYPGNHSYAIYAVASKSGKQALVYKGEVLEGWRRAMNSQYMQSMERFIEEQVDSNPEELEKSLRQIEERGDSERLVPYIPFPGAESRLALMDIPLPPEKSLPDNAVLLPYWNADNQYIKYRVVGLPRLHTVQERLKVERSLSPIYDEKFWKSQPLFIKALREEWQFIHQKDPGDLYRTKVK